MRPSTSGDVQRAPACFHPVTGSGRPGWSTAARRYTAASTMATLASTLPCLRVTSSKRVARGWRTPAGSGAAQGAPALGRLDPEAGCALIAPRCERGVSKELPCALARGVHRQGGKVTEHLLAIGGALVFHVGAVLHDEGAPACRARAHPETGQRIVPQDVALGLRCGIGDAARRKMSLVSATRRSPRGIVVVLGSRDRGLGSVRDGQQKGQHEPCTLGMMDEPD